MATVDSGTSSLLPGPVVTLYSRTHCHLCEDAHAIVEAVAAQVGAWVEVVDIDTDADLRRQWTDQVPVVLVDGEVHAVWRVDPARLRAALGG